MCLSRCVIWIVQYIYNIKYICRKQTAPPIKLLPFCFISLPNWQPSTSNLAPAEAVPNVFACPCPNGSAFGDIVGWRISCQPRKENPKTVVFDLLFPYREGQTYLHISKTSKKHQKTGSDCSTKTNKQKTLMDDSWICRILAVISLPLFCLVHVHRDWGWRRCRLGILTTSHEGLLGTGNRRHWMWPIKVLWEN